MEKLVEALNEKTNNEYKFMLKSAFLKKDADFCVLEILYKDGQMLSNIKKQEIKDIILSIVPKEFKYEINFIKNFISEERIETDFKTFMQSHFPSVFYSLGGVNKKDLVFYISLCVDNNSYEHTKQKNLKGEAEKYFKALYEDYSFICNVENNDVYVENAEELLKQAYTEEEVDIFAKRKIEVSEIVHLVGNEIEPVADYIIDKTSPAVEVVVCGKIKNIKPVVIKRKPKEEKQEEVQNEEIETDAEESAEGEAEEKQEKEIKYERKLYKFVLEDFTGQMNCVYFSNKETQVKAEKLDKDSVIIVRGNLENDKFSNGLVLSVKDFAYCTLPENFVEYVEYRKEKPFYEWIKPEPVTSYVQDDLMSFDKEQEVPEYLQNKTFVCFDFETTGLHYENGDKIIEIGAVKIKNGKITEKFMSYVDPERKIPAESSAISGIVDSDVEGAPKDYEALQDFYKFTRGAILTGYNIAGFDMRFLLGQGKKCRWNFDNSIVDTIELARKYVFGVKNYKLGTIAEKLGVKLDNAHRAVYDAMATAEVFIILAKNLKNAQNEDK